MKAHHPGFDEHAAIHELKHYLPAQAPLKDFIHHNTLHAFQSTKFYDALRMSSQMFGYKVLLNVREYRSLLQKNLIQADVLNRILRERKGGAADEWREKMLNGDYGSRPAARIGKLRATWKTACDFDLDAHVHPILFRILCSYLDQGIALWDFPVLHKGFLPSLRELERNTFTSFFSSKRARDLLLHGHYDLKKLLKTLVGDNEALYKAYLFDQQFAHPGWSGLVSAVEDQPETLLSHKKIALHDLIVLELLLEIDALDSHLGKWQPLETYLKNIPEDLFAPSPPDERSEVLSMWQDAFEWTYYDQVLAGIQNQPQGSERTQPHSFQVMFCIDDRECSLRRYLEQFDARCETFGTPGFFGVEFFFKPQGGKFYTKLCPAPVTPKYLIKEEGSKSKHKKDIHFTKRTHSLARGWIITQTIGFWSAFKLFMSIFRPSMSPATANSFQHMDKIARLSITHHGHEEHGLQVGFKVEEMADRVESLLKSIGLVQNFAPIVYVVGHGSSSTNNPHYAAYDCGACSGRPGSVNARVICYMANHAEVRETLLARGIEVPASTQFVGGLHDTTRDEIVFFDEQSLSPPNAEAHRKHEAVFAQALDSNAKERSRRLELIDTKLSPDVIHEKIKRRSVSLFEPRPELNHATNALCIVGRRELSKRLFLDRRSFLNSYDYRVDPDGRYLLGILKAAAPVCGGINLEYFFSRVDNQKLGAGSKLPHNVMGLFGVANGYDGDLRPGLPNQMVEVHDPVRLLIVVEQFPEVVQDVIQRSKETYEWFINEWVHLAVIHPERKELFYLENGVFSPYQPLQTSVEAVADLMPIVESHDDNIPVYSLS